MSKGTQRQGGEVCAGAIPLSLLKKANAQTGRGLDTQGRGRFHANRTRTEWVGLMVQSVASGFMRALLKVPALGSVTVIVK